MRKRGKPWNAQVGIPDKKVLLKHLNENLIAKYSNFQVIRLIKIIKFITY